VTSDPAWRRGLAEGQLRKASRAGASADVALLTRRLLQDSPNDVRLQFGAASSAVDDQAKAQARQTMRRLAFEKRYLPAAQWLLKNEFTPVVWSEWDQGRRGEFGKLLAIVAEAQPDNLAVRSMRADYWIAVGAAENALAEIEQLWEVQPARGLQGALLLRQLGRNEEAVVMARKASEKIAKQSDEMPQSVELALLHAQFSILLENYQAAYERLLKTSKLVRDARLEAGKAEVLVFWSREQATIENPTERFAKQLKILAKAFETAPNHPLVINDLMVVVLQCTDNQDENVAALREVIVQGVEPDLAHFIHGTAALLRDDVDEAMVHLEMVAKTLPSAPSVLNNLAMALVKRDESDLDRALKLVDAALEQVPEHPYFHETRAQILLKQTNYKDAIIHFERSLRAEAIRQQVHEGLSEAYAALGQSALAEEHKQFAARYREQAANPAEP
jgi:tetratricopeptide (TPR) repeat protein